tara:strand:+ start:2846 stop:3391 length:546 start_codon:yes stop_codon:yes gene_type:complete
MPFIGQEPITGAYHVLDAITASATATYNLQLNGGAFSPATANQLIVSLNGVIQKPGSSFNISGSQITFSSALTSSDSIDFIMALGDVLNVGTPTDGTVNSGKIASSAVTNAKINFPTKTTMIGDGSDTTLTINSGRTVDDVLVFVNGICLVPTDDYTISGTTLTFITAPSVGSEVTVRYIG